MYGKEVRMVVKHDLDAGMSKAVIARKLGISRGTVERWAASGQLDDRLDNVPVRYSPRKPVERKIDQYRGIIDDRLKEHPDLSAVRLLEEIRKAGYDGGYTQVKEYVRRVRPRPEPKPPVRFETPPGRQGQVDFAEFDLPWGKRYGLFVVLGHSRLMWAGFYERQTMEVLMHGLERAFRYFGGVPGELLFDQMKAVVVEDRRPEGGGVLHTEEFRRFAAHWGFKIRVCRPYRPETKGKVERTIRYMRGNFMEGRKFINDADLGDQLEAWLLRANDRIHGTTRERPWEMFHRDELGVLGPLADGPYRSLAAAFPSPVEPSPASRDVVVARRPLSEYAPLGEVSK